MAFAEAKAAAAPQIDPSASWVWQAWQRLDDDRQYVTTGMAVPLGGLVITPRPRRIPWSAILAWSEYNGFDRETHEVLDYCITEMDAVFLAHWRAETAKAPAT